MHPQEQVAMSACRLWLSPLSPLLTRSRPSTYGIVLPTEGGAFPHQLLKQSPPDMITGQLDVNDSSLRFSFHMILNGIVFTAWAATPLRSHEK